MGSLVLLSFLSIARTLFWTEPFITAMIASPCDPDSRTTTCTRRTVKDEKRSVMVRMCLKVAASQRIRPKSRVRKPFMFILSGTLYVLLALLIVRTLFLNRTPVVNLIRETIGHRLILQSCAGQDGLGTGSKPINSKKIPSSGRCYGSNLSGTPRSHASRGCSHRFDNYSASGYWFQKRCGKLKNW